MREAFTTTLILLFFSTLLFSQADARTPIITENGIFNASFESDRKAVNAEATNKLTINIEYLPQGLWLFAIHTDKGIATKRVVKK